MVRVFLNGLLQSLAERGRELLGRGRHVAFPEKLGELADELLSSRGEASGVALACVLLESYAAAEAKDRLLFLTELAERFGPRRDRVDRAIEAYRNDPNDANLNALHLAAEPTRQELKRRINLAPGGTAALVGMRQDLLSHLRELPRLEAVDADFHHLFSSWFNRGFLVLRPIDWSTPANILEKVIQYEAVHAIQDWEGLRLRLEPADRRCLAFFHPQWVDMPLIFVEVALTRDIPNAIAPLLAVNRHPVANHEATTAVFYSISSTQKGLAGVSFGNFLIKQVVEDLQRSLPNLKQFVTLSPTRGFASWLERWRHAAQSAISAPEVGEVLAVLDSPGCHEDAGKVEALRPVLLWAAADYYFWARSAT